MPYNAGGVKVSSVLGRSLQPPNPLLNIWLAGDVQRGNFVKIMQ